MELILTKPIEELIPALIAFNNEEIKRSLAERLQHYNNLKYDDKQIANAKTDRATLNKFKDALDNERKRIKKTYLEPYEKFEAQVKELLSLVEQPISAIDSQIKNYENEIKQDKKNKIDGFFEFASGELFKVLPYQKVFKNEWLNATYKWANIENEIKSLVEYAKKDLKIITDLNSKHETHLKDFYLNCLDLTKTMSEKTRLEQQELKMQEVLKPVEPAKQEVKTEVKTEPQIDQEQPKQFDFRVWATKSQLDLLKSFLKQNNIKFGKVE